MKNFLNKIYPYVLFILLGVTIWKIPVSHTFIINKYHQIQYHQIENKVNECFNNGKINKYTSAIGSTYNEKQVTFTIYVAVNHYAGADGFLNDYSVATECVLKNTDKRIQLINIIDHYFQPFLDFPDKNSGYELRIYSILRFGTREAAYAFIQSSHKNEILKTNPNALFFFFFQLENYFGVQLENPLKVDYKLTMKALNNQIEQHQNDKIK